LRRGERALSRWRRGRSRARCRRRSLDHVVSQPSARIGAFMFAVVLVAPEIPPNTGNVIRLTANTATELHLIEPLGFRMDDRELKRAGLDYHEYARVRVHGDFAACRNALDAERKRRYFALATPATQSLYDARFAPGDVLVF